MKKHYQISLYFLLLVLASLNAIGQTKNDNTENEIKNVLKLWNDAAKKSNLEEFMSLYDNSASIILVGSDSGEVFNGSDQIRSWLGKLFMNNSFEWELSKVYIDHHENTAWVFVDGAMIVTNKEGKKFQTPYRFTGVMVRKNKDPNTIGWKWRLFNGSIPQGE